MHYTSGENRVRDPRARLEAGQAKLQAARGELDAWHEANPSEADLLERKRRLLHEADQQAQRETRREFAANRRETAECLHRLRSLQTKGREIYNQARKQWPGASGYGAYDSSKPLAAGIPESLVAFGLGTGRESGLFPLLEEWHGFNNIIPSNHAGVVRRNPRKFRHTRPTFNRQAS